MQTLTLINSCQFTFMVMFFRSLGVHVSKVRSLTLDAWEPEQIKVKWVIWCFNNCLNKIKGDSLSSLIFFIY